MDLGDTKCSEKWGFRDGLCKISCLVGRLTQSRYSGGFYPLGPQVPHEFFYWDATGLAIFLRGSPGFFFFFFYSPQVLLLVFMFWVYQQNENPQHFSLFPCLAFPAQGSWKAVWSAGCPSRLVVPENGALGVFWFHFIAVADAVFSREELPRGCMHQSVAFCALASARRTCVAPSGKPSDQHRWPLRFRGQVAGWGVSSVRCAAGSRGFSSWLRAEFPS